MLRKRTIIQKLMNQPGLVGCWIPEKQGGGSLRDLSGKNNHGILDGPTWISEDGIWRLSFDGINDKVTYPASESLRLGTENFSIEYYQKHPVFVRGWERDFWKYSAVGPIGYIVYGGTTPGETRLYLYFEGVVRNVSVGGIDDDIWHQIVFTVNRNGYLKAYKDGMFIAQIDISAYSAVDIGHNEELSYQVTASMSHQSRLGSHQLYRRVLPPDQIRQNYELTQHLYIG